MSTLTLDELLRAAAHLAPDERRILVEQLQEQDPDFSDRGVTRASLIREWEAYRASGVVGDTESLYGKFAHPDFDRESSGDDEFFGADTGIESAQVWRGDSALL